MEGAQPNNSLVVSSNPTSGRRFRFFCRSNSLTKGVGQFIGTDKTPVTTNEVFEIESQANGGQLTVENNIGTNIPLPANRQGVYTCRMPLEGSGEMKEFNIGLYPFGFNSELSNTRIIHSPRFTLAQTALRVYS